MANDLGEDEDTQRGLSDSYRDTGRGLSKRTVIYVDKPEKEEKRAMLDTIRSSQH